MSQRPETPTDIRVLLSENLGLTGKELEQHFEFVEKAPDLLEVHLRHYIEDYDVFSNIRDVMEAVGGRYVQDRRLFRVPLYPKKDQVGFESTPASIQVPPQGPPQEEYDLKASKEIVGTLYPILKDAWGNIIDGFHRQRVDPKWPSIKLRHITDPVQLNMARLIANVCRREVPAQEKSELLGQIAKLTGWTPKQIAEALPMKKSWVYQYLPHEYKERPGAGGPKPVPRRGTQVKPDQPPYQGAPVGSPTEEKDTLLEKVTKYYPLELADEVWQRVTIPSRRLPFLKTIVEVLWERAVERGITKEILEEAKDRFEQPERVKI